MNILDLLQDQESRYELSLVNPVNVLAERRVKQGTEAVS